VRGPGSCRRRTPASARSFGGSAPSRPLDGFLGASSKGGRARLDRHGIDVVDVLHEERARRRTRGAIVGLRKRGALAPGDDRTEAGRSAAHRGARLAAAAEADCAEDPSDLPLPSGGMGGRLGGLRSPMLVGRRRGGVGSGGMRGVRRGRMDRDRLRIRRRDPRGRTRKKGRGEIGHQRDEVGRSGVRHGRRLLRAFVAFQSIPHRFQDRDRALRIPDGPSRPWTLQGPEAKPARRQPGTATRLDRIGRSRDRARNDRPRRPPSSRDRLPTADEERGEWKS